jgi:hypothetical protein
VLAAELRRELAPAHALFGRVGSVIGRDASSDDIVAEVAGGGFAIIHLTWTGRLDPDPERYPATRMLRDIQSLLAALDAGPKESFEKD